MSEKTRGRDKFYKYKKYIILLSKFFGIMPLRIRLKIFEHFRMTKGIKGIVIRYALLKSITAHCGDNVSIQPGVYILNPEKISFGDNVSVHPMCYLDATGGIFIGNDVSLAHGVTVMSSQHNFEDAYKPIKDQGVTLQKTIINENVWIGAKATILAGKIVESGSIVGANTVITKNVDANSVVVGIPGRTIKKRVDNYEK